MNKNYLEIGENTIVSDEYGNLQLYNAPFREIEENLSIENIIEEIDSVITDLKEKEQDQKVARRLAIVNMAVFTPVLAFLYILCYYILAAATTPVIPVTPLTYLACFATLSGISALFYRDSIQTIRGYRYRHQKSETIIATLAQGKEILLAKKKIEKQPTTVKEVSTAPSIEYLKNMAILLQEYRIHKKTYQKYYQEGILALKLRGKYSEEEIQTIIEIVKADGFPASALSIKKIMKR